MVGDSKHDVDSARSAGAASIGVLSGVGTAVSLRHANFVLPSVTGIPSLIDEILPSKIISNANTTPMATSR